MVYFSIKEKNFNLVKSEGIKIAKEAEGEDYEDNIDFDYTNFEVGNEETSINDGVVNYNCSLYVNSNGERKEIGYISHEIALDLDDLADLVNFYMKKLGKLKTIFEATK